MGKISAQTLKSFFRSAIIIGLIVFSGTIHSYGKIRPFESYKIIAHGLGGLPNEKRVTNSIDALIENYKKGTRIFEVDLIETSDGYIVARHDWLPYLYEMLEQQPVTDDAHALTLEEFKSMKINKQYEPATLDDILNLMLEYPDIYIVTDTKTTTSEDTSRVFKHIVDFVKTKDEELLKRIYPQIYNKESYYALMDVYPFKNVLYTLYYETSSKEDILNFSIREDIRGIVIPDYYYTDDFCHQLRSLGMDVYVHTVNNLKEINKYLSQSVTGVFSDYVSESHLN